MNALTPVFVHGDCHTDNIALSGESSVFLDWQGSGIGRPRSDLAFFNARAMPGGVTVPPALLDSYLDGRPEKRRTLELALLAEELAAFVFQWPFFAAWSVRGTVSSDDRQRKRKCPALLREPGTFPICVRATDPAAGGKPVVSTAVFRSR
jgi:hypothetical protein